LYDNKIGLNLNNSDNQKAHMNRLHPILVILLVSLLVLLVTIGSELHNHESDLLNHDNCPACFISATFHFDNVLQEQVLRITNQDSGVTYPDTGEQLFPEVYLSCHFNKAPPA